MGFLRRWSAHFARRLGLAPLAGLGPVEKLALALLLIACLSPYGFATAEALTTPEDHRSVWNTRVFGTLNVFDIGFALVVGAWVVRAAVSRERPSSLDGAMLAFLALVVGFHSLAVARGEEGLTYQLFEFERVGVLFAGYLLLSRLRLDAEQLRAFVKVLLLALAATAAFLLLRHGIFGSTNFVASDGEHTALIATEDGLVVGIAGLVAWGMLVDGLLPRRLAVAAVLVVAAILVVDLLSVRRAALLFVAGTVLVRSLWAPARMLLGGLVATALAGAALLIFTPGGSLAENLDYTARSALLQTANTSTFQRRAELQNFSANITSADDLLLGRGLGASWTAHHPAPVDPALFGSGETELIRIGWHIYGLDWLYKLGVLGMLGMLGLLGYGALQVRAGFSRLEDRHLRSLGRSFAVVIPPLLLLMLPNPRLGVLAGVAAGVVSKVLDLGGRSRGRRPAAAPVSPARPR